MSEYIWLVPLLPLLGVIINTVLGLVSLRQHRAAHPGDHAAHVNHVVPETTPLAGSKKRAGSKSAAAASAIQAHSHVPTPEHVDEHADHGARRSGIIASAMVGLAFILTVLTLFQLLGMPATLEGGANGRWFEVKYWDWMVVGELKIPFGFLIDQLSVTMMLLVTGVGLLIHVYSIGYMSHDPRPIRFFAYLNLFIVAMLLLVMGNNFVLLFLGWEGVGLCSFLLIGFWFEQRDPPWAATKAFVVNRVGDFGLLLAMFAIWGLTRGVNQQPLHSLVFREVLDPANTTSLLTANAMFLGTQYTAAGAIAFMLLVGVTGKSAQLPLFVWLPDAMAGPTPVSALIHAATMVTAGVYLVVRTAPIFALSESVLNTMAAIGAATAFIGATIAIGQYDIKKVLAYSTVSQLGYMVAAVGMGAYTAGMFHLLTHGIFKALLFLGAGAVIHGYGNEQDMRKMGGLRKVMPRTFATYLIGTLALAGIFPLAGFWSKDEIIGHAFASDHRGIGIVLVISSMLTAFYMARQVTLIFLGEQRDRSIKAHESSPLLIWPLLILAVGAVVAGLLNLPTFSANLHLPGEHGLHNWLSPLVAGTAGEFHLNIALLTTVLAVLGGAAGYYYYSRRLRRVKADARDPLHRWIGVFYEIAEDKWYLDDLYHGLIVRPFKAIAEFFSSFFDKIVLDGVVNGLAALVYRLGRRMRLLQSGYVRSYALMFLLGVVGVVGYFVLS